LITLDNRKLERCDLSLPVKLFSCMEKGELLSSKLRTKNICTGGAFIESDQSLPLGSKVSMLLSMHLHRFTTMPFKKMFIKVSGEIIRSGKDGMAIRFSEQYEYSPILDI